MRFKQGEWSFRSLALLFLFLAELALIIYGASYGRALHRGVMELTGVTGIALHMAAFAILTITALLIWKRSLKLLGALVLAAIGLEVAQIFLPNRDAYVSDAAASMTGLFIGWMMNIGTGFIRDVIKRKTAPSSSL